MTQRSSVVIPPDIVDQPLRDVATESSLMLSCESGSVGKIHSELCSNIIYRITNVISRIICCTRSRCYGFAHCAIYSLLPHQIIVVATAYNFAQLLLAWRLGHVDLAMPENFPLTKEEFEKFKTESVDFRDIGCNGGDTPDGLSFTNIAKLVTTNQDQMDKVAFHDVRDSTMRYGL